MASYLEVWIVAKPFEGKLRFAGMNIHQKNMFLSLCKMFIDGFGEKWDRKEFIRDYIENKQTSIKFWGGKEYLLKQQKTIEEEAFKAVMEDKYKAVRDKVRRLTPKKFRRDDEQLKEFSKFDKFVASLAYFNISLLLDVKDE